MKSGIYKIMCLPTGKVYIGQSKDVKNRFKYHLYDLKRKRHGNPYFMKAFEKWGKDAFNFDVLEYCDEKDLNERELHYINLYKSCDERFGYNILTTPVFRDAIKERWSKPDYKKKITDKAKSRWENDKEFRDRNLLAIKKAHEERRERGEILGCLSEEGKKKSKEASNTLEHRKIRSELAYKQLENPQYVKNNLEILKRARLLPSRMENLKKHNEWQANDEEHKKRMSELRKAEWANEEHKKKRIENIKIAVNDPEVKKKQSESMKEKNKDPKFINLIKKHNDKQKYDLEYKKIHAFKIKKKWEDPEYRQKTSLASKKKWERSEVKEAHSQGLKEGWKDPVRYEKGCKAAKKRWEGEENRKKNIESIRKSRQDPEFKKKQQEIMKSKWSDPEFRKARIEKIRNSKNNKEKKT